jgi:Fe-S-cluster containining protein
VDPNPILDAGEFGDWLAETRRSLREESDADVACGPCTACCTSAQFVHIAPDEIDTLAHVPTALLFPAPRLPAGHVVIGYDDRGHCPMLVDGACSIYEHRPRTCRTYDCRVFPATGVDADKPAIAERATRWRFRHPKKSDRALHVAARRAGAYLLRHRVALPPGAVPANPTQLAVLAIELHERFLDPDHEPDVDELGAQLRLARG